MKNRSTTELDQEILPPVPTSTHAYLLKDTEHHKDDTPRDYHDVFLTSVLNIAAFIEQAEKKRKSFYGHGNIAKEAIKYKLQTLSRDFNVTGKQAQQIIKHNMHRNRKHISEGIAYINHNLSSSHSVLNDRVNRTIENLTTASRKVRLDMKRNARRLRPPPVTFHKKHYAAFVSASAIGLTTTFVMNAANSNTPQDYNAEQFSSKERDFLVEIDTLADVANDHFILTDEIEALTSAPVNQASHASQTSPWNTDDTAILRIPLADDFRISSRYGMRLHPVKHRKIMHDGIDVAAPTGTPIEAPSTGTVEFAGRKGGYGKTVILDHGHGIKTLYAHLSRIHVNRGDQVRKGEVFAKVGATGRVTGAHLHFEIHKDGKHINPSAHVTEQRERREIQIASGLIPPAPSPKQALR